MLNASDYAIFAANAYAASDKVVTEVNEIKTPSTSGWDVLLPAEMLQNTGINDATGFLARAYRKGNEIVISYGGTTPENGLDWTNGNLPAALGYKLAPQVLDAARFYLDVVKANPGATVTFTGHSLGGGLASLMAVYFNKSAQTFDQAPFGKTAASASIYNELKSKLELDYSLPADFLSYSPATGLDARKSNVTETYLKGEALQYLTNGAAAVALTVLGGGAGLALGILVDAH